MHSKEVFNKNKELTGYRMFCNGRNPKNNKYKLYTKTWNIPSSIKGKKDIEKALKKAEIEFESEVEKMTFGTLCLDNNVLFIDYAKQYGEELKQKESSFNYYEKFKFCLPLFEDKLSIYKLKELNKQIIRNFFKYVSNRRFKKQTIVVKRSIFELIKKENNLTKIKVANECGINRLTLRLAAKIGQQVTKDTAKAICKYFNVPMDRYFEIKEEQILYSKATNNGIRAMLSAILSSAVEDELIDYNFITQIPTGFIGGREIKKKEIYNTDETQDFVKNTLNEPDIRKRVIYAFYVILGIRSCEACGLEWPDFDIQERSLTIQRNSIYTPTFGTRTKTTKTKCGTRILALDDDMFNLLLEYKEWWQKEKTKHGDLWGDIDRLFVNSKYRPMAQSSIAQWLRKSEAKFGLKHIPPHSLRHTNITQKLVNGIDPLTVAYDAGHADVKTTLNTYGHYLTEKAKDSAREMNNVFFAKANIKHKEN